MISEYKKTMFMSVSVDVQPCGINLAAGFSPDDIDQWERHYYPHTYVREEDNYRWVIRASNELSIKLCVMLTEYGEQCTSEALAKNARRKVVNRR